MGIQREHLKLILVKLIYDYNVCGGLIAAVD